MIDPITPAQRAASTEVNLFLNNQKAYWDAIVNGIKAQPAKGPQTPAQAAITAVEFIAALGTSNKVALDTAYGTQPTA